VGILHNFSCLRTFEYGHRRRTFDTALEDAKEDYTLILAIVRDCNIKFYNLFKKEEGWEVLSEFTNKNTGHPLTMFGMLCEE